MIDKRDILSIKILIKSLDRDFNFNFNNRIYKLYKNYKCYKSK